MGFLEALLKDLSLHPLLLMKFFKPLIVLSGLLCELVVIFGQFHVLEVLFARGVLLILYPNIAVVSFLNFTRGFSGRLLTLHSVFEEGKVLSVVLSVALQTMLSIVSLDLSQD